MCPPSSVLEDCDITCRCLIAPLLERKFKCCECGKEYNSKEYLSKHERNVHNIEYVKTSQLLKCALCDFKHYQKPKIILHLSDTHQLNISHESKEFEEEQNFLTWKTEEETRSKCKFVATGGKHKHRKTRYQTLVCHRSQYYTSKGRFNRSLKLQGSCKLDAFCPAEIRYTEKDGIYKVQYVNVHTHETELGHLRLPKNIRSELAKKIASGIPFDIILDEVRESLYKDTELNRSHLLTKKDLHNIANSFNVHGHGIHHHHKNDATSVEAWIREEAQLGPNSCVLFYKPQDHISQDFPEFKSSDFVLLIMNDAQSEILKKFGADIICMDGTFGLNQYDFQLITLLVIDNLRQGFLCSFLISNRCDEIVLKVFFLKIKERVGEIFTNNFMSDMEEAFFNAYSAVMPLPKRRLFCAWHVDRAWRKNLSKIKSKEKQCQVYKLIRTLMEETDEKTFQILFEKINNYLTNDEELKEFGNYFISHYGNNVKSWAFCFRLHSGINTNMHLERMHRTLKEFYCHGKKIKRLDKMIYILQKFIKDRLYDQLIAVHKGKTSSKITDLRKRHLESNKLDASKIVVYENGWLCPSSTSAEMYFIQRFQNQNCNKDHCYLKCITCNYCIHDFCCTCTDNAIKWNMCKHIHLLCQSQFLPSVCDTNGNNVNSSHCFQDFNQETSAIVVQK